MRIILLLLGVVVSLTACNLGAGSFCATGTSSVGSTNSLGCLSIVKGFSVKNGRAFGDKQNLIYLMIICSNAKAAANQGTGTGIDGNPMSTPFIYYDWETTSGTARVSLDWNTRSDMITVGGEKFDRTKGNVFFIERKPDGKLFAKQCGLLGPAADFSEIDKQVRQALPGDELVKSAKFQTEDQ